MRGQGLDARVLRREDDQTLSLGRQVARGYECLPMTVTIGWPLQTLREKRADGSNDALFMPSGHGPSRFGQYNLLERLILEKEGFGKVAILAPDNDNAYQSLEAGQSLFQPTRGEDQRGGRRRGLAGPLPRVDPLRMLGARGACEEGPGYPGKGQEIFGESVSVRDGALLVRGGGESCGEPQGTRRLRVSRSGVSLCFLQVERGRGG